MNMEDNNSSFFSKSEQLFIDSINTIFSFATSIKAEERLFYDKKLFSDKIRLGLLLWSSRTFDFIIACIKLLNSNRHLLSIFKRLYSNKVFFCFAIVKSVFCPTKLSKTRAPK
jgi:hypothetical protein